jgi:arylsulfatase A-like enzyme
MQGQSWRRLVAGQGKSAPRRDSFVYSLHGRGGSAQPVAKALRTERYKLILNLYPKDKEELYDLKTDPLEMKNVADQNKELVAELKRTLIQGMKQIDDPAVAAVEATTKP